MSSMVDPSLVLKHLHRDPDAPVMRRKRPNGKPGPRQKRVIVAERRLKMASMFGDGKTLEEISKATGLSKSYISEEIDRFVREIESRALEPVSRRLARSEAVFKMVQMEATLAWYASQKGRKVTTQKTVRAVTKKARDKRVDRKGAKAALDEAFAEGDLVEDEVTPNELGTDEHGEKRETSPGDPRWLAIIADMETRILELRRLKRGAEDGPQGGGLFPGMGDELRSLSMEDRMKLIGQFREKAQMKKAQTLALRRAPSEVIDVEREPDPRPEVAHPAPVEDGEDGDAWLL